MNPSLRHRAARVGLTQATLAERAGRDKHTVGRVLSGDRNVQRASEVDVIAAIEAEERAVLAHLLALHPDMGRAAAAFSAGAQPHAAAALHVGAQPHAAAALNGGAQPQGVAA